MAGLDVGRLPIFLKFLTQNGLFDQMTMPGNVGRGPGSFFGGNLTAYVQNNTIPLARINDMAVSPNSSNFGYQNN